MTMKWSCQFWLQIVIITFLFHQIVICELINPYNILRVKRSATQHEIKKAYKALVKEWYVIF